MSLDSEKTSLDSAIHGYLATDSAMETTEEMNDVDVDNTEILQQENIHKDDSTKSKPKIIKK